MGFLHYTVLSLLFGWRIQARRWIILLLSFHFKLLSTFQMNRIYRLLSFLSNSSLIIDTLILGHRSIANCKVQMRYLNSSYGTRTGYERQLVAVQLLPVCLVVLLVCYAPSIRARDMYHKRAMQQALAPMQQTIHLRIFPIELWRTFQTFQNISRHSLSKA
jgi:hypothetical protein